MKKLSIAVAAALLLLSACGGGSSNETNNSAGSEASSNAADSSSEPASESIEENTFNAYVQSLDSNGKKIKVEMDDGKVMSFDISSADINPAWELMKGDYVEISYDGSEPMEGMAVKKVKMDEPFEATEDKYQESPFVYGRIESIDDKTVSLREVSEDRANFSLTEGTEEEMEAFLGKTYKFSRADYETLMSKAGAKPGVFASIYYIGDLSGKPVSYKILTDDMMDDDKAFILSLSGKLKDFKDGIVYLELSDGEIYKFDTYDDETLVKNAKDNTGKDVEISFSDSILKRVVTADSIKPASK